MQSLTRIFRFAKRGFRHKKAVTEQQSLQPPSAPTVSDSPVTVVPNATSAHVAPVQHLASAVPLVSFSSTPTLQIALVNQSTSSNVYAYITGIATSSNNALFLLQADGTTPYYPSQPSATGTPLGADCAIRLGAPGSTRTVTIPQLAGARLWFSIDSPLTFLVNPGPALVEPSVTNPTDPNINVNWGFAEFTYNSTQIYANISYVDFVSIPIALTLTDGNGVNHVVTGMRSNGFSQVCAALAAQSQSDGVSGWTDCIVQYQGKNLRALSPNNQILLNSSSFQGYWDPYVNQVWSMYSPTPTGSGATLTVSAGNVNATGTVGQNSQLNLSGESFAKPSTIDIFSANSGPFTTGTDQERNTLIPQLAAAFNRSTLLSSTVTPTTVNTFYKNAITNHYSRIVHEANIDGAGYGFPYDDVAPSGGADQSGYVSGANPTLLTVTVGGGQYN